MVKKTHLEGFSLIEISISLIILGIVSSIGISQLKLINKVLSHQKTQSNIDFVVKSLGVYCTYKALKVPFPSKINENIGYQNEDMKNSFGIIPFKSLGIMEKFAKDGNGRWILYKMNPDFGKLKFTSSDKSLGIKDFYSEIAGDRVAFIIKTKNVKNEDELTIWYSEKNFIANYTNIKPQTEHEIKKNEILDKNIVF